MLNPLSPDFRTALRAAMETQIIPHIFSAEQRAGMTLPGHETADHYDFPSLAAGRDYEGFVRTGIADPRIDKGRIAALPRTLKFIFEGETHKIPLRFFKYSGTRNIQRWQNELQVKYAERTAAILPRP